MFVAAVIQLSSISDSEANWASARELIQRASDRGATLIATPENTNLMASPPEKLARAETLDGTTCSRFSQCARELKVHLLLGSFNEKSSLPGKCHNTSILFGPDGKRRAVYRKIHLFDVDLSERVRFKESEWVAPGSGLTVASTDVGKIGLSICYDLRFPALYWSLAARGAEVLAVPSAFTLTTGKDHWTPLLRARAIETQCYVLAPAQWGKHDPNGVRESYGHSMIVDPWGQVVAQASDGPGLALAEIDLERVARLRRSMPVREHAAAFPWRNMK